MSPIPSRPVQVRLPLPVDAFLTALAEERGETKTAIVVEALECLRRQVREQRMEAGYREMAGEQRDAVVAGLAVGLPAIPD